MSLAYTLFRYADNVNAVEALHDLLIHVCMRESGTDTDTQIIDHLIDALHLARIQQAEEDAEDAEDEREVDVPVVANPDEYFIKRYIAVAKASGVHVSDGDAWWEDFWPYDRKLWHKEELNRLADLKVGETQALSRSLRIAHEQAEQIAKAAQSLPKEGE